MRKKRTLFPFLILKDHESRSLERSERMKNLWTDQKKIDSFSLFLWIPHFWKTNWLYHPHGMANFWAELDLNQRRHIANEFTVRPH